MLSYVATIAYLCGAIRQCQTLNTLNMASLDDFFARHQGGNGVAGLHQRLHSCPELMDFVRHVGFLPLLDSGIPGFDAESLMAEECRYTRFADGSWEWPLWQWKGSVVRDGVSLYGKFFAGKAGFVSREWWPDFYNWRRSRHAMPEEGSIENTILSTLREQGSMVARELRAACGFTGGGAKGSLRSRFDGYVGRLQMACYIVTEDFVYPTDKHGREYGFGWSLLTTPERLLGREACVCERSPEESWCRMTDHLARLLPHATENQIAKMLQ